MLKQATLWGYFRKSKLGNWVFNFPKWFHHNSWVGYYGNILCEANLLAGWFSFSYPEFLLFKWTFRLKVECHGHGAPFLWNTSRYRSTYCPQQSPHERVAIYCAMLVTRSTFLRQRYVGVSEMLLLRYFWRFLVTDELQVWRDNDSSKML